MEGVAENVMIHGAARSQDPRPLTIGIVSNASAAGQSKTLTQFQMLLAAASGNRSVELLRFTLRERGEELHGYIPIEFPPAKDVDALIVTGTEPSTDDLRAEWFWRRLTWLHDWAEQQSIPVIWSCLAAHAAVLHRDGIKRQRLLTKLSGVFSCTQTAPGHKLTFGMPPRWHCPHSRYNSVSEDALLARGYSVLSRSAVAGVDIFTRMDGAPSLYFQGHPEYQAEILLREFLRDLRRYEAGESRLCPAVPSDYLDVLTERRLVALQRAALGGAGNILHAALAYAEHAQFRHDWSDVATTLLARWLDEVAGHAARTAIGRWPVAARPARPEQPGAEIT